MLPLHDFHLQQGAQFQDINGTEVVASYGEMLKEHGALGQSAGVLDLSSRGRLCVTGADRVRFLHGQVTNDVRRLGVGSGCYAALTTAKGKMESDLYVYVLQEELLLDFEPGLSQSITQRLEKFAVADDVQVVDVASLYGLLSVQGPDSWKVVSDLELFEKMPEKACDSVKGADANLGEIYLVNQARLGTKGFDLFVPSTALLEMIKRLLEGAHARGGCACGWDAFEIARIEAGIPRFGADMDETNFPQECGIDEAAVSYNKGCYVGQETLNRIHTLGHVNRKLQRLRLDDGLQQLPTKGDKLFHAGKEAGYITSAVKSLATKANIGMGYVRADAGTAGTELVVKMGSGDGRVVVEG